MATAISAPACHRFSQRQDGRHDDHHRRHDVDERSDIDRFVETLDVQQEREPQQGGRHPETQLGHGQANPCDILLGWTTQLPRSSPSRVLITQT